MGIHKSCLIVLGLFLVLLPHRSHSQSSSPERTTQQGTGARLQIDREEMEPFLDAIIREEMEKEFIPGVVFALVKDGKMILAKGYGFANIDEKREVSPDKTIFRIGSISKVFTALGVMQQVDLRKIGLDDDVNTYLTRPKVDNRYVEPVRFRHLLTHTAGFDQVGDRGREFARAEDRKATLSEYLADTLVRIRPPGQVSCYDTWGITLAGHLLEKISGLSYAEYMKQNIFRPLRMTRTHVETPEPLRANLAMGYRYKDGKYIPQGYEYYATTPASSIDSTALDMAQLMIAILGDGSVDGETAFLSLRAIHQIKQLQFSNAPGFPAFSYGFFEDEINGQRGIHHGGNMHGFETEMYMLPNHNLGFFIAYNCDRVIDGPRTRLRNILTRRLMDRWFPPVRGNQTSVKPPLPIKTERFAGNYAANLYCHTCYEGDEGAWPMFYTPIKAVGEGLLEIDGDHYRAIEPLIFQSEKTGHRIAFRESKDGQITHVLLYKNEVREKLGERLLDEVLGAGWRDRPVAPLAARVYRTNEEWEKAAAAYASIASQRPQDGSAVYTAGVCWVRSGKLDNAVALLQRAWELRARPPQTAFWLGAVFGLKGDKDQAFAWLKRAIEAGFDDKERLEADPMLKGLRDDPRFKALQNK